MKLFSFVPFAGLVLSSSFAAAATSATSNLRGRNNVDAEGLRSLQENGTDDSLFDEKVVYCIADIDFNVNEENATATTTDDIDGNSTEDEDYAYEEYPYETPLCSELKNATKGVSCIEGHEITGNNTGDVDKGSDLGDNENATGPNPDGFADVAGNYTVDEKADYVYDLPLCSELDDATKAKAKPIYRK